MDKQRRFKQLQVELQRLEQIFKVHNDVPGHPDFCVQQSVQIKVWDCLLGSPESPANVWVDWTASLDRKKVLKALRMAVKRMEYDNKLDEFFRLRQMLAQQVSQEQLSTPNYQSCPQPPSGAQQGGSHEAVAEER